MSKSKKTSKKKVSPKDVPLKINAPFEEVLKIAATTPPKKKDK